MFWSRIKRALFLLSTVAAFASPAFSEEDTLQRALNNMAHEMVECAAYFNIVSAGMRNSNDPDGEKSYKNAADTAAEYALIITEQAGLMPETVVARIEISLRQMIQRIGSNTSNISILLADYSDLCVEVMEDPTARANHWMEKFLRE